MVTASELLAGDAVSAGGSRTTFFGGSTDDSSAGKSTTRKKQQRHRAATAGDRGPAGHAGTHGDALAGSDRDTDADARRSAGGRADAGADRGALTGSLGRHGQGPDPHLADRADGAGRRASPPDRARASSARRPPTCAATTTGKQAALERRHLEAAEQIVAALGTMKGAAMKLGQVLSFLDVGLVPEEHREEFQRKLGELRDAAPKVRFDDMRKVIESELEAPLDECFAALRRGRRSPPPRSARSTARGCTTGATSRSRSSTRASPRPSGPTCRTWA